MAFLSVYKWFGSTYNYYLDHSDPRVRAWPMIDNDSLNFFIIACYMMFVFYLGPAWMRDRKPFDLRRIMVPYNVALVIVNFIIFVQYTRLRWVNSENISCLPLRLSNNKGALELAEITWWFYLTKYVELCDTVFFVLRKKENQLSGLHLIHHSTVPLIVWSLLRFEPGGYNTFFPQANSFVHCIMYTYYAISAFGDDVHEHLWFKKYITMTQLIQFLLVLSYFLSRPFMGCKMSVAAFAGNVFISGFFLCLFINFYYHAYIKNKAEKAKGMLNGAAPKCVKVQ